MTYLLTILKNWKTIIIVVLLLICVGLGWKITSLKSTYQKEIISLKEAQLKKYEEAIKENQAHNKRIAKISLTTDEINKKIKEANIQGKCQNEEFYNLLNTIVERHNSRVR
jgi:predicted Holliday junction resolvase-like endonuclease